MSLTRLEDEGLPKNPNLQIAEWKFLLQKPDLIDKEVIRFQLMNAITMGNMAPFYEECCSTFQWKVDQELLNSMKSANEKTLKELEEQLIDAETNLGEMEVRDTLLKKSEYLCSIGAKEAALDSFRETYDKTISLGQRLDIIFHLIRIGFFYFDHDLIAKNIEKAQSLIEKGGDWDRRNRLKVYQGVFCMMTRNFKCSPNFFLDTSLTFTSYEIMDYSQFVRYIILISMIALSRSELRKKIIKSSEIAEVLYSSPEVKQFLYSLFNCQYAQFFKNLANMESVLKSDYFLSQHYQYYIREMKIIAYSQLLESYRSLSLQYMAKVFGVTEEYMDQDLSRFIAAGRLNCKIDKVSETVETNHPDSKYWQYLEIIKQGDILLNRVQKLSRVIDI